MSGWIGFAIVQPALQGIFLMASYEYGTTGVVPSVFTPNYVVDAWRPKQGNTPLKQTGRQRAIAGGPFA